MRTHEDSLSMLSPKPGVSTMVNAIRTPSSSSSARVESQVLVFIARLSHAPTFTGLMRMFCSTCAVAGSSETLCASTSDSQSVFTKVVRPVPEAPGSTKSAFRSPQSESFARVAPSFAAPPPRSSWRALHFRRASPNCKCKTRTDDHERELHALLDLVARAPACERHLDEFRTSTKVQQLPDSSRAAW